MSKIKRALTRKFGVGKFRLPAWAWLGLFAVAVYLYRRRKGAGASSSGLLGTTGYSTLPASSSGYGAAGADLGPPPLEPVQPAGVGAPLVYDPVGDTYSTAAAAAPPPARSAPPPSSPTAAPTPTVSTGGGGRTHTTSAKRSQPYEPSTNPASQIVQTAAGGTRLVQPLLWGGRRFYDKRSFQQWALAHGTTASRILASHPEATLIYNHLPGTSSGPLSPSVGPKALEAALAGRKIRTTRAPARSAPSAVRTRVVPVLRAGRVVGKTTVAAPAPTMAGQPAAQQVAAKPAPARGGGAGPAIINPPAVQPPKPAPRAKTPPPPSNANERNALVIAAHTGRAVAL